MPDFAITEGAEYVYARGEPVKVIGARYRVLLFYPDIPSYQQRILVETLTGPDAGLVFGVSPANFASRYEPAPQPREEP